jgi:hypothetical protein
MSSDSRICISDFPGCVVAAADAIREHFGEQAASKGEIDRFLCSSFKPIADLQPWNKQKYCDIVFREVHQKGMAVCLIKDKGFVFRAPPEPVAVAEPVNNSAQVYRDDDKQLHVCKGNFETKKKWTYVGQAKCYGEFEDVGHIYQHEEKGWVVTVDELDDDFCKDFGFRSGELAEMNHEDNCDYCGYFECDQDDEEHEKFERRKKNKKQKTKNKA